MGGQMWNKVYNSVYVLRTYDGADGSTTIEGVFVDMDSCIEYVIDILRGEYTAGYEDFPEDKIRSMLDKTFMKYNNYWNSYTNMAFIIETSNIWKYERGC